MRAIRCLSCCIALLLLLLLISCRRGGERILETGTPTAFLECDSTGPLPPADTSEVGSNGGTLTSGNNVLIIPPEAIQGQPREIIFATESPPRVGVRIRSGGNLARTAELQISAAHCPDSTLEANQWFIWRGGNKKLATDTMSGRRFRTQIDSTSGFMIAH